MQGGGRYLLIEPVHNAKKCRFFLQILIVTACIQHPHLVQGSLTHLIPWTSRTFARKCTRYPGELVREVPHGDSDTSLHRIARGDDHLIVLLLLSEKLWRSRKSHADIELSDSYFDSQLDEGLDILGEVRWELADNEVRLKSDTIYGYALFFERFDEILVRGGFGAGTFNVKVVCIEFCVGIGFAGGVESGRNEL